MQHKANKVSYRQILQKTPINKAQIWHVLGGRGGLSVYQQRFQISKEDPLQMESWLTRIVSGLLCSSFFLLFLKLSICSII